MNSIIRYWNQNRRKILFAIIVIVLLIVIVHIANEVTKQNRIATQKNKVELTEEEKKLPTQSIIGGEETSIKTAKENTSIIEEFVEKCNNKQITEAYNMLTDECKNTLFKDEKSFVEKYYNRIFTEKRLTNIQSFLNNSNKYTYLVKYYEDALSKGKASTSQPVYQDYITIDQNSKSGKINLNNLIEVKDINKTTTIDGIKVTVLEQEIFKDYEKFKIRVDNTTDKRISINTRKKDKSIFILGSNGTTYDSNINEISSILYEIPAKFHREYELKFNKLYSTGSQTAGIVFSDIIPDYEKYKEQSDKLEDRVYISVNI